MRQLVSIFSTPTGKASLAALCLLSASGASANLIISDSTISITRGESAAGTAVTDATGGSSVGNIAFEGGNLHLSDATGVNPVLVQDPAPDWWHAGGAAYTTSTHTIFIDFVDLFVTGFSFNIGANVNASAWITAYYDDGNGSSSSLTTPTFGLSSPTQTPGFGVFVNEQSSSCARITRIEVDPPLTWGVGNFAANLGGDSCVSVPEPGPGSLIALGLLTLGFGQFVRSRRYQAGSV